MEIWGVISKQQQQILEVEASLFCNRRLDILEQSGSETSHGKRLKERREGKEGERLELKNKRASQWHTFSRPKDLCEDVSHKSGSLLWYKEAD